MVELEKAGYVQRRQTTDKAGKFGANEYVIREYPVSREPLPGKPTTDAPSTDCTPPDLTTQLNIDLQNKEKQKTDLQSTDSFPFLSSPPIVVTSSVSLVSPEMRERKRERHNRVSKEEMDLYREVIRENICYDELVRECPRDTGQLDEMVELIVETVCSRKETIRVAGNDFPQEVVKSRLLKLDREHIQFVFDCLRENTTQVRNMKQYLLTVLYNAPATIENHYAARVNHDLNGDGTAA